MNYIKVVSGKFLKTEFLKSDMFYGEIHGSDSTGKRV